MERHGSRRSGMAGSGGGRRQRKGGAGSAASQGVNQLGLDGGDGVGVVDLSRGAQARGGSRKESGAVRWLSEATHIAFNFRIGWGWGLC
jgi:hypothetical protein